MGILLRIIIYTISITLIAAVIPGIEIAGFVAAVGAALVLGIINAIVRPILLFFTLPLTLLTLGLFLLVLNGFCFWLASVVVKGFEVYGFFPAVFGALLMGMVSWFLNAFMNDRGRFVVISRDFRDNESPKTIDVEHRVEE